MPESFFKTQFSHEATIRAAAPGRLEFIGNHTDYNGGLVMGLSVRQGVVASVAPREDNLICLYSCELDSRLELDGSAPIVRQEKDVSWTNYVLGVLVELRKLGVAVPMGFEMTLESDLPFGAGMSSSAAVELATARALTGLAGVDLELAEYARLCRRAENEFVGVPCGILDQGVSAFGQKDALVLIDCEQETFERVAMPHGVHFWVFNTRKKHALVDSLYETRHRECMLVFKAIQARYPELSALAHASLEQLRAVEHDLPLDAARRARHVIDEHARVADTARDIRENDLASVGAFLTASHRSSQEMFENSCPELDFFVESLEKIDTVYGSRLTGGGFGGAVMAMTNSEFSDSDAQSILKAYEQRFRQAGDAFHTTTGPGVRLL